MAAQRRARILGTGSYVPERVVTNRDLGAFIATTDAWIVERTGIRERRWVQPGSGVGSSDLGAEAGRRALADAQVLPGDIDLIIFATLSPDHDFPGNGPLLQRKLGMRAPTLDIRQQCTGFVYGLSIADAFIRGGIYRHVLVVAAEVQSTGLDVSDAGRDLAIIFGDGAGAAVVGPAEGDQSVLYSTHLHVDGQHAESLWCEFPSSRSSPRLTADALAAGRHFPKMNGKLVFKHAVHELPLSVREALHANGRTLDELRMLVPHQANVRIIRALQQALGLDDDRVAVNIDRYGNTTGASIPLALDEARREGRVGKGDLVCLTAFGAGFTWGSTLLQL